MTPSWWQGLALGLVQGFTEFLPVSSSGHLVVAQGLLGFDPPGVAVEVGLHLATLLSVLLVYRTSIATTLGGVLRRDPVAWRETGLLLLASVPAGVAGVFFRDLLVSSFSSYLAVSVGFLLTAAILWSTRRLVARQETVTVRIAVLMGLAQAVAILPGVSRSGSTITAALWQGVDAVRAAEFSFLMSIIVIAGSGLVEARHLEALPMSIGFVAAFVGALVSGIVAIHSLVWLLRARRFHQFAPYLAAISVLTFVWSRLAT